MNAFDELQRQLIDSVAGRARMRRSVAVVGLGRWWRARTSLEVLVVASAALVITFAVVATLVTRSGAAPQTQRGAVAVFSADSDTPPCAPCRAVDGRLHGPLSEEGAGEGAAAAPAPAGGRGVRIRHGRPIVRWTSSPELPPEDQSAPVG